MMRDWLGKTVDRDDLEVVDEEGWKARLKKLLEEAA
jgi:hypothetical protein